MTDDGQLLRQYLEAKSEAAFAELVQRHLNLVYYAALRRLGSDAHAAADVSQRVFIVLARKAWSLCGHPSLTGWLYSAVNFEVSELLRSTRRRQIREQEVYAMQEPAFETGVVFDGESLRPFLDDAVLALGTGDREAVLLRFFEGCPFSQIGGQLGISEAAAQKRVGRALEKLRRLLEKRGLTSASTALTAAISSQAGLAAPAGLAASISSVAMASGITSGSATLAFIQIMSITKLSAGVAGLLALAALLGTSATGVALHQFRKAARERVDLADVRGDYRIEARKLANLQSAADQADQKVAALKLTLATAHKSVDLSGGRDRAATRPVRRSPQEEAKKFLTAYPEARVLILAIGRTQIASSYGPFFKSQGLSQAQIDQFIEATQRVMLQSVAVAPGSIRPSVDLPPADQLRPIIGEDGYRELQNFKQIMPAVAFTNQAAVAASFASVPLSGDQQDQLVQIVAKNSSAYQMGKPLSMPEVDWDAVMPQAQAVVSPTQWKAVQATFLQMQLGLAFLSASNSASSSPAAASGK